MPLGRKRLNNARTSTSQASASNRHAYCAALRFHSDLEPSRGQTTVASPNNTNPTTIARNDHSCQKLTSSRKPSTTRAMPLAATTLRIWEWWHSFSTEVRTLL